MRGKKRVFLLSGGVLAVAALICFHPGIRSLSIPRPELPRHGSAVVYEIARDLAFPAETEAPLYRADPSGEMPELQQALAADPGMTVDSDPATGTWTAVRNDDSEDFESPPESIPSDGEAAEAAKAYIGEHALFAGDLGEPAVSHSTTGSGSSKRILHKVVAFHPAIDGKPVYGVYRISLNVGAGGEILDVFQQAGPMARDRMVPLKTKDEVLQELRQNPEKLSSSADEGMTSGLVTHCSLAYYVDGHSRYACPVYVLSGTGTDGTGTGQEFDIILDAVRR